MAYIQDVQESVPALPEAGNLTSFVVLSQNENGRKLLFKIVGVDIPSGSTATFSGTKPDGVVYSTTGTISGNIVTVNEDTQMTAVAGSWDAKIRVLNGGNVIASAKVRITIDADPVAPGSIPSDSQLDGIVAECQAYAESARSDAYGSPLTASTAAGMIDKIRVYVYTGSEIGYTNGHWYYWDGTAWTDGGTYNSSGIQTDTTLSVPGMAADAKTAGDEISDLKEDLTHVIEKDKSKNLYNPETKMDGYQLYSNGTIAQNASYNCTGYIDVSGCEKITIALKSNGGSTVKNGSQNAFYDSNKSPVTTRNELGEIKTNDTPTTFTVPNNAKYFAIAYSASVLPFETATIMVQSGEEATPYEPYKPTTYIIYPSDETKDARGSFDTLGDRLDFISTKYNDKVLIYWGDSLTEGDQAGDGGSIPGYMSNLLDGWTIYNYGRGGDLANSVACRQGGMAYVVKAGQTIPASGSVTLDLTDNVGSEHVGVRTYTDAYSWGLNPCYIAGVKGNLLRVSSSYPLDQGIFTRETSGDAVEIDRPTEIVPYAEQMKEYPMVIAIGTNVGFDTSDANALTNIVRWMVNYSGAKKYLVMGLYHTGANWQKNANTALKNEFGRHYIDAETYMKTPIYDSGDTIISSYALADEGITPTAEDLTAIENGSYPPSIMYDNTHFNKYGYDCIAKLQYNRGKVLGYWD